MGDLTRRIIGCVIRVHQGLGPGFLENVYRRAMAIELRRAGLSMEVEREVASTIKERTWDGIAWI